MAKKEVKEWFSKAEKDLDEAKFLFENRRPLEDVAYFVHQVGGIMPVRRATEKGKGASRNASLKRGLLGRGGFTSEGMAKSGTRNVLRERQIEE